MKNILQYIYARWKYRGKVRFTKSSSLVNSHFEGNNAVFCNSKIVSCYVGSGTYISNNSTLVSTKIGRYCSIADNVSICIGNHPTSVFVTTHPAFYYNTEKQCGYTFHKDKIPLYNKINVYPEGEKTYQVKIGNDVWIGSHVLIIGGITIGDGAIIAAGAVVCKDVEPYTVVAGIPAKPIKKRFSQQYIEFLLKYKWWDKQLDFISANYKDFQDVDFFYEKYNKENV